jgi:DNA-binding NarL/FixJ family response regulator
MWPWRGKTMRILIAVDHDLILEGLRALVRGLGDKAAVLACGSLAGALDLGGRSGGLDLAILDLELADLGGPVGVGMFCARFPGVPTVVVAERYRREEAVDVLRQGAAGFVPRGLKSEAMRNALRLVLSGERFAPAELISGQDPGAEAEADVGQAAALRTLTGREADVLEELLDGRTNKEIGRALGVEEVTVKLHLRSIYRKLAVRNRAQAVRAALDARWRRPD